MEARYCQQCGLPLTPEKIFKSKTRNRGGYATYVCESGHRESLKNHTHYEQMEKEVYEKNRKQKCHRQ